jgi:hypothetical protein
MVWTWSIWLRIGTSGGPLWTRQWTFGFHKIPGSSWVAAQLAASQDGLSSTVFYNGTPLSSYILATWRWKRYVSPKRRQTTTRPLGVTFQRTVIPWYLKTLVFRFFVIPSIKAIIQSLFRIRHRWVGEVSNANVCIFVPGRTDQTIKQRLVWGRNTHDCLEDCAVEPSHSSPIEWQAITKFNVR